MNVKERLRLTKLTKYENGNTLLDHITLVIREGEAVGLYYTRTPSKDALLRIISGYTSFDSGYVYWDEESVPGKRITIGRKIAIMDASCSLIEDATIAENVFILRRHRNFLDVFNWKSVYAQTALQLREFHLSQLLPSDHIFQLTSGEIKLIEMLRAVILGAKLIVINDVLGTLDSRDLELIIRTLPFFKQKGISILIFDSKLSCLQLAADRSVILEHARTLSFSYDSFSEAMILHERLERRTPGIPTAMENLRLSSYSLPLPFENGKVIEICNTDIVAPALYAELMNANPQLCSTSRTPFSLKRVSSGIRCRYIDYRLQDKLFPSLSTKENLLLPIYPRLSKGPILSHRRANIVFQDFIYWYGDEAPIKKTNINELTLQEKFAILLYRYRIEGIRLLFCADPRIGFDVKTYLQILDLLHRLAEKTGTTICILTSDDHEHIPNCNQLMTFL